jgi:hypothetical protein
MKRSISNKESNYKNIYILINQILRIETRTKSTPPCGRLDNQRVRCPISKPRRFKLNLNNPSNPSNPNNKKKKEAVH